MKKRLVIGTRKSRLAMWQSEYIKGRLESEYPGVTVGLSKIVTKGDKILDVPLAKIGDKGLFTKELESALLTGETDLAVHSLKDMPMQLPDGLCITAVTKREDPGDAFVSNRFERLEDLPEGAVVGTSSLRRKAQLLAWRPDLDVRDLRGNVDTRLKKLDDGEFDAVVLASSGLKRLGHADRIRENIPFEICVPAVGQGALAIECREDDEEVRGMLGFLNDTETRACTDAERAFMTRIGGGCQVPVGVHAELSGAALELTAVISSLDGSRFIKDSAECAPGDGASTGSMLGEKMLRNGGDAILAEIL
ncbi:MAG: hydroxymethylbilane synthase [Anaerovoracaceae bacterium]